MTEDQPKPATMADVDLVLRQLDQAVHAYTEAQAELLDAWSAPERPAANITVKAVRVARAHADVKACLIRLRATWLASFPPGPLEDDGSTVRGSTIIGPKSGLRPVAIIGTDGRDTGRTRWERVIIGLDGQAVADPADPAAH